MPEFNDTPTKCTVLSANLALQVSEGVTFTIETGTSTILQCTLCVIQHKMGITAMSQIT